MSIGCLRLRLHLAGRVSEPREYCRCAPVVCCTCSTIAGGFLQQAPPSPSFCSARRQPCTLRAASQTIARRLSLSSQTERVLFHYNGHGVPRPTANGEIWVFNSRYTQYIPLSVYELHSWVAAPCIYVLDCSAAGLLLGAFKQLSDPGAAAPSPRGPAGGPAGYPPRKWLECSA